MTKHSGFLFYTNSGNSSLNSKTTAEIKRNAPKTKRSLRSGTYRIKLAPITAPGMLPTAIAKPAI